MTKPKRQVDASFAEQAYAAPPMYAPPTAYPIPMAPQPVQMVRPPARVDPYHSSSAQLLQDRNATVAKVSLVQSSSYDFGCDPDFSFTATGSSKREQGDKFNARTGELLALSRAYLRLSRDLFAAGRELVEPAPEPAAPEDDFIGIGFYAAEDDPHPLEDPTDEEVDWARQILCARADYTMAVAERAEEADEAAAQAETDAADARTPAEFDAAEEVAKTVLAFNAAADALNTATDFIRSLG